MNSTPLWALVVICGLGVLRAPQLEPASSPSADCSAITEATVDDCVRLNEIQMLGTHNSYHVAPAAPMLDALGARARNLEYTHKPLVEQLSQLGIRQVELDVFFDPACVAIRRSRDACCSSAHRPVSRPRPSSS